MIRVVLATNDRFGLAALNGLEDQVVGLLHFCSPKQSGYVSEDTFRVKHSLSLEPGQPMAFAYDWLVERKFDVLLCCGWSKIVPEEILDWFNVIGMHPTKLPDGRGGAPIVRTILDGVRESAISFYRMTEEVDFGDVVYQAPIQVGRIATSTALYKAVCQIVQSIAPDVIEATMNGTVVVPVSSFKGSAKRPQRKPWDSQIDWNQPMEDVQRFIRACSDPYPVAFGALSGYRMSIFLNDGVTVARAIFDKAPGQQIRVEGRSDRLPHVPTIDYGKNRT